MPSTELHSYSNLATRLSQGTHYEGVSIFTRIKEILSSTFNGHSGLHPKLASQLSETNAMVNVIIPAAIDEKFKEVKTGTHG